MTRLTQDCSAILGWYDWVHIPDDTEGFLGDVPPALMQQITATIREHALKELGKEYRHLSDIVAALIGEP